jgi:hypothetical protein
MTTALQIMSRAAELIGYKDPSEALSGDDTASFLAVLNDLVDAWNTQRLNVVASAVVTGNVSASPVSIGSGQTISTTRPIAIEAAWIRESGIDYPLEMLTSSQYDAIVNKADTGRPSKAFYSATLPAGSLYLWPVPSASFALYMRVATQLTAFTDAGTDYNLAPGYKKALEYSLAEELAPGRGPLNPQVLRIAQTSRRALKVANYEPIFITPGVNLSHIVYDIVSQ